METKKLSDSDLNQVAGGAGYSGYVSSGSFSSNTGTKLNLVVNWSVTSDGFGMKTLHVDVCAASYSLYAGGTGIELTVNGMSYWGTAAMVNYGGNTMVLNCLASFSVPNVSGALNISAVWHYNGTYSGVPIADIHASGMAYA